ncbi:MAG: hypothetical protein H6679_02310 [Epsilonproteobacteria bacterium]|nr:hypothetical protein [Campylobacterota bacterium]
MIKKNKAVVAVIAFTSSLFLFLSALNVYEGIDFTAACVDAGFTGVLHTHCTTRGVEQGQILKAKVIRDSARLLHTCFSFGASNLSGLGDLFADIVTFDNKLKSLRSLRTLYAAGQLGLRLFQDGVTLFGQDLPALHDIYQKKFDNETVPSIAYKFGLPVLRAGIAFAKVNSHVAVSKAFWHDLAMLEQSISTMLEPIEFIDNVQQCLALIALDSCIVLLSLKQAGVYALLCRQKNNLEHKRNHIKREQEELKQTEHVELMSIEGVTKGYKRMIGAVSDHLLELEAGGVEELLGKAFDSNFLDAVSGEGGMAKSEVPRILPLLAKCKKITQAKSEYALGNWMKRDGTVPADIEFIKANLKLCRFVACLRWSVEQMREVKAAFDAGQRDCCAGKLCEQLKAALDRLESAKKDIDFSRSELSELAQNIESMVVKAEGHTLMSTDQLQEKITSIDALLANDLVKQFVITDVASYILSMRIEQFVEKIKTGVAFVPRLKLDDELAYAQKLAHVLAARNVSNNELKEVLASFEAPVAGVLAKAAGYNITISPWLAQDLYRLEQKTRKLEHKIAKVEGKIATYEE